MRQDTLRNVKIPTSPHFYRVGEKVFDDNWNEVPVKVHHGWRYIQNGGKVGISSLLDKTGDKFPVYWDYVFGWGRERYSNFWYDKLLNNNH